MNGGRSIFDPSPLEPQTVKPARTNRLSRSLRLTQAVPAEVASPRSQRAEFKSPTRIARSKAAGVFSAESPHTDSDFQQDIIWDATSPSPRRPGKKGKKHAAGVVNISEIVSRIAPKHGRPQASEPTLQQWIGDSATIPCTPDVQAPRAKKKSPRPTGVDDLLRLAKQFDFNMFHQDDDEELQNQLPSSPPGDPGPAAGPEARADPHLDLQLQDDLDFLFDGPTQPLSRTLSQPTQVKAAPPSAPREAHGKPSSHGPSSAAAFEDDWEDDDLLNDSLVLEITQNPQNFMVPKLCSTQKPAGQLSRRETAAPVSAAVQVGSRTEQENVRPRATFRLQPGSDFSERRTQTYTRTNCFSAGIGPQRTGPMSQSNPVKPEPQRSPAAAQSFPKEPDVVSSVVDFLDDDLDSFFSSDPIWDDPADDDLLCEMCEDLENQVQTVSTVSTKQTPGASSQRAPLQPTHRTCDNRTQAPAAASGPTGPAPGVTAQVKQVFGSTQTNTWSGSACRNLQPSSGRSAAPPPQRFTFKKPNNPVSMETSEGVGKCSAAEIELKKQQAMARRRRRLQAAQNVRAPT